MTDFIEYHPLDNPEPAHVASVMVPLGEWVEVPGFAPGHTLEVMHEDAEDDRLRVLLERPGKLVWHPAAPTVWLGRIDGGDPIEHVGTAAWKVVIGDEPEGHAHSGPEPCPADECEWRP